MKSGWWSGDGGDFHNALLPRIVKDCTKVEIEYYFLQYIDPAGAPGLPTIRACPRSLALSDLCRSTRRSPASQTIA
jgi:hypothetical protein